VYAAYHAVAGTSWSLGTEGIDFETAKLINSAPHLQLRPLTYRAHVRQPKTSALQTIHCNGQLVEDEGESRRCTRGDTSTTTHRVLPLTYFSPGCFDSRFDGKLLNASCLPETQDYSSGQSRCCNQEEIKPV